MSDGLPTAPFLLLCSAMISFVCTDSLSICPDCPADDESTFISLFIYWFFIETCALLETTCLVHCLYALSALHMQNYTSTLVTLVASPSTSVCPTSVMTPAVSPP